MSNAGFKKTRVTPKEAEADEKEWRRKNVDRLASIRAQAMAKLKEIKKK